MRACCEWCRVSRCGICARRQVKYECPMSGKYKVHGGFYRAYQSIAPAVERTCKRLWETGKYDFLVVCGHSLGGALATLAAMHLTWSIGPVARKKADRIG